MCLSIPMQVVALEGEDGDCAIVERRHGNALRRERVNMMLVGPQPIGTWILASLGLAKEVLDDHQRTLIEEALDALAAAMRGDYDPSAYFSGLTYTPPGRSSRQ
ncbi:MAG: HypC/HybG/HupF family hydrogenase formation chaperone [Candidatus Accumulibacter sp.]|nr:HypC/HybG/HupF family hydrogenase formation chaperone [Accumulibacter sp.]